MYIPCVYTELIVSKEYRAKVFKSGNSLALRLPKELGLKEGSTMVLREERSGYRFEPEDAPKKKLDISGFWARPLGSRCPNAAISTSVRARSPNARRNKASDALSHRFGLRRLYDDGAIPGAGRTPD
jgi:antitoxin VapB